LQCKQAAAAPEATFLQAARQLSASCDHPEGQLVVLPRLLLRACSAATAAALEQLLQLTALENQVASSLQLTAMAATSAAVALQGAAQHLVA
jgi:hypothetical protein